MKFWQDRRLFFARGDPRERVRAYDGVFYGVEHRGLIYMYSLMLAVFRVLKMRNASNIEGSMGYYSFDEG